MADSAPFRPDARRTLSQIKAEWSDCTKCNLGVGRETREASIVFGRGRPRKLMIIGEGPSEAEEAEGKPFLGKTGHLLHRILDFLGVKEFYETNLVACRSCELQKNAAGEVMMRNKKFVYKDEPPTPPQYTACLPRLYAEIYAVDPLIIIGLGGKVCEALLHRPVTISREHGDPKLIEVPGASYVPVLTEKKQDWLHRTAEGMRAISEQNMVSYYLMPTHPLSYVQNKLSDMGHNSPFKEFIADLKKAVRAQEMYNELAFGTVAPDLASDERSMQQQIVEETTDQPEE